MNPLKVHFWEMKEWPLGLPYTFSLDKLMLRTIENPSKAHAPRTTFSIAPRPSQTPSRGSRQFSKSKRTESP